METHTYTCDADTHDVVVIIVGAIAATFARSTMAAVLSLGAVGYGVATTFLMFGANRCSLIAMAAALSSRWVATTNGSSRTGSPSFG